MSMPCAVRLCNINSLLLNVQDLLRDFAKVFCMLSLTQNKLPLLNVLLPLLDANISQGRQLRPSLLLSCASIYALLRSLSGRQLNRFG